MTIVEFLARVADEMGVSLITRSHPILNFPMFIPVRFQLHHPILTILRVPRHGDPPRAPWIIFVVVYFWFFPILALLDDPSVAPFFF